MSVLTTTSADLRRTASLPSATAFTTAFWFYSTADPAPWGAACALEGATGSATNGYYIIANGSLRYLAWWDGGGGFQTLALTVPNNTWTFLALTCSGTASGNLSAHYGTGSTLTTVNSNTGLGGFTPALLCFGNDSYGEYWTGRYAAIRVWDRALTATELEREMQATLPMNYTNIHAIWPSFQHTQLEDWSGNTKSLTANGTLSSADGPPIAVWPAWEDPKWQGQFITTADGIVAPPAEDRRPRFKRTPARTPLGRRFLRPTIQAPTLNDANIAPNTSDENVTAAHDRFGWSPSRRPMQRRALRPSKAATDFIFTPAAGQTIAIGQATETDVAQPIAWAPKNRLVNQVLETDTAQAVAHLKLKALGQVLETDLAQPLAHAKVKAIGQCTETDTAQPIAWAPKNRLVNQALETDLAQPITRQGHQVIAANQATETDTAQPIAWAPKKRLVAQVAETDLAQSITRVKRKTLGIPIETDLAQALAKRKLKGLGLTTETDLAQVILWSPKRRIIGQVVEVDLAQPVTIVFGERLLNIVSVSLQVSPEAQRVVAVTTEQGVRLRVRSTVDRAITV